MRAGYHVLLRRLSGNNACRCGVRSTGPQVGAEEASVLLRTERNKQGGSRARQDGRQMGRECEE